MTKYIIKRILWMIPVLLGVTFIVFALSYFTPGDPVITILGTSYTEELYLAKKIELGLDKPFLVQYLNYIWGIISRFDFGTSYIFKHEVGVELASRIGFTLKLAVSGMAICIILGIPFGIISATKQYSALDYAVTAFATVFAGMPGFWMALMLVIVFALHLKWFPATGFGALKFWVLPVLATGLRSVAVLARQTRSSMLEVIRQDYIRTARAKGLAEGVIIRKHALKNALIPIVTVIGMQLSMLMSGSVVIETIFNIPGIGSYMLEGINASDYPIICGCVVLISFFICVMNIIVDLVYAAIDPRIKSQYESGKKKKQAAPSKAVAADKKEAG